MTLGVIAVLAVATWLTVLTLAVLALARQTALVAVRMEAAGTRGAPVRDGPVAGSAVPAGVLHALGRGDQGVLLLSATCLPCRSLAPTLGQLDTRTPLVILLPGPAEAANELTALLPHGTRVLRDPDASRLAASLSINSTPFAVHLIDGIVKGKAYVRAVADLGRLLNTPPSINAVIAE